MRSPAIVLMLMMGLVSVGCSDYRTDSERVADEFEHAADRTGTAINKGARAVENTVCDLYDSEAECAAKRAKNEAANAKDDMEDKLSE